MANEIALKRKNLLETINGQSFKTQMQMALPKHLNPDRMLRIALTAMNKTPKLYDCDPNTVLACMMDCSQLGLEPDGRNAYLIPFGSVCQLIIGYQGFIELAYRHPLVKGIRAKVVYEKDHFEYDEGLEPRLVHKPFSEEGDPGKLTHAYAICDLNGGGRAFVVLSKREVMKAKSYSRSASGSSSPWTTNEAAMWLKTAVRQLAKFMPRSSEMVEALQVDDRSSAIDIESITSIPSGSVGAPKEPVARAAAEKPVTQPTKEKAAEPEKEQPANPPAEEPASEGPSLKELRKEILKKLEAEKLPKARLVKVLADMNLAADETVDFAALPKATLQGVSDGWEDILAQMKAE